MIGYGLRDCNEILHDRGRLHAGEIGQIRAIVGDDLQILRNGDTPAQCFAHAEGSPYIGADYRIHAIRTNAIQRLPHRTTVAVEIHDLAGFHILISNTGLHQLLLERQVITHRREGGLLQIEDVFDLAAGG